MGKVGRINERGKKKRRERQADKEDKGNEKRGQRSLSLTA